MHKCGECHQSFLDPRTKLALIITVSGLLIQCSMVGWEIALNVVLLAVPIVFLIAGKRYGKGIFYALLFLLNVIIAVVVIPQVGRSWTVLLGAMVAICIKVMPGLVLGFHIMGTIEAADLIAALEKTHMPKALTWTISIVFRFFPTAKEELSATIDGIRVRGHRLSSLLFHPIDALTFVFVPLIVSVVSIGDELVMATLTKGFSIHGARTSIADPVLRLQDYGAFALMAVAWILHFVL